jgi:hypothetical protein
MKFKLGRVVTTIGAVHAFMENRQAPNEFITRHVNGDWGELCEEDKEANEIAIKNNYRILSKYRLDDGQEIYICTEWDRSYTTVMKKEDY